MKFSATKIVFVGVMFTVIILNFLQIEPSELLKTIATSIVAFYFGQKSLGTNITK